MTVTTLVPCILITLIIVVNGQSLRNITVDDTDPAITYVGNWGNTDGRDSTYASYGGSHQYTTDVGASATFTFTGVAVHFMTPAFNNVSTILTLDSGPAQWVDLTNPGFGSAVRWSARGLNNGKHTLVSSPGSGPNGEAASWGESDAFIYTVVDPDSSVTTTSDDPRITYNPPGAWAADSTHVPSCARSKSGVRVTSTRNAIFSFDFSGDSVNIYTVNSPGGGKYSVSINGGPEQIYDTYASSTECGSSSVQKMKARRLVSRSTQNKCTVKVVEPPFAVDGVSYDSGQSSVSAAHKTTLMNCKFYARTFLFIPYLLCLFFFHLP